MFNRDTFVGLADEHSLRAFAPGQNGETYDETKIAEAIAAALDQAGRWIGQPLTGDNQRIDRADQAHLTSLTLYFLASHKTRDGEALLNGFRRAKDHFKDAETRRHFQPTTTERKGFSMPVVAGTEPVFNSGKFLPLVGGP